MTDYRYSLRIRGSGDRHLYEYFAAIEQQIEIFFERLQPSEYDL
ncbi:hypothetical protein [Nostoc sp.]